MEKVTLGKMQEPVSHMAWFQALGFESEEQNRRAYPASASPKSAKTTFVETYICVQMITASAGMINTKFEVDGMSEEQR